MRRKSITKITIEVEHEDAQSAPSRRGTFGTVFRAARTYRYPGCPSAWGKPQDALQYSEWSRRNQSGDGHPLVHGFRNDGRKLDEPAGSVRSLAGGTKPQEVPNTEVVSSLEALATGCPDSETNDGDAYRA